ncbi:MAG: hypothetical protein ACRDZY_21100, partial [Acidimicrobiales bacterium]
MTPPAATEPRRPGRPLPVEFARALRAEGVEVATGSVVLYAQALSALGLAERAGVYWAGRATLVRRPEDTAAYDRAFGAFWLGRPVPVAPARAAAPVTLVLDEDDGAGLPGEELELEEATGTVLSLRYSATEVLRSKDFATCTAAELAQAYRLMARVRLRASCRPSRRR